MSEHDLLRLKDAGLVTSTSVRVDGTGSGADIDDVSAQKPNAYLEPNARLSRALFENAPVAILMVDQVGKIMHLNAAATQLFGYSKEELAGQPVEILVPPEARMRHKQLRTDFTVTPTARPMAEGRRLTALNRLRKKALAVTGLP